MKEDRKKMIWLGGILLCVCIILFANNNRIDTYLSNAFTLQEENPEPITYSDEITLDGVTAGREIIQPLTFTGRVGHIGIKIGTYARENHSTYEISLIDQWGNILGMEKVNAADMKDNEYYYIKIERFVEPEQIYYLKIISDDADEENAITCYVSESVTNQEHVMINGIEQNYSLIMTFMYGTVNSYTSKIVVILLIIYLIYVAYQLVDGHKYYLKLKNIVLSKRMHQIAITVFLICFIVAVFNKNTVYKIIYVGGEYNREIHVSEALLDNVTVEETFVYPEDGMNCIEVKFALFLQTFQSGIIHFELYESGNPIQIREGVINATNIKRENISFSFPEIKDSKNKEYILKIYTTEVSSDNAMSVFYTSDSSNENVFKMNGDKLQGDLIFTAGVTQKEFNLKLIFVFAIILVGITLFYLFRFNEGKRKLVTVAGILFIGCIGVISLKTYSIYHQFSIDGMVKVLITDNMGEEKNYSKENVFYEETFSKNIRTDGTIYGIIQMIELHNINTKINTILIKFSDSSMDKRIYYISVFYDTGNGYNQKYTIPYIYHGESEILLHIPFLNTARSIRIDLGKQVMIGSNIEWNEKIGNIEQIVINKMELDEKNICFYILPTFLFFAFLGLLYLLSKKLKNTEKVIENSFAIVGIIFGIIMSVLIPVAQVPDEGYHLRHTLYAIGGDNIYEQMQNINKEIGIYQISGMTGEKVNVLKYQTLLTTYLESYQLNNVIEKDTLEILKRPGQTLGILLAIFFKMPIFWIYFLGELGGLLVYMEICFLTLKLLPNNKELMCMIMLMPMSIQEAGSFSYDSFNNALCFFMIAYIMHLSLKKEKINLRDIGLIFSIGILLFYIKTIYAGIVLLIAIIPIEQYDISIGKYRIDRQWIKSNIKKVMLGMCFGIIILICIVVFTKYEYVAILIQTMTNISEIIRLFIRTFIEYGTKYIVSMIANFGEAADTPVGQWYIVFYLIITLWMCFYCNRSTEISIRYEISNRQKVIRKSVIVLTTVLMITVIILSMITSGMKVLALFDKDIPFGYKIKLLNVIDGVQGRYFIPILPMLLFIPEKIKRVVEPNKKVFLYAVAEIITVTYVIYILLQRYWI